VLVAAIFYWREISPKRRESSETRVYPFVDSFRIAF